MNIIELGDKVKVKDTSKIDEDKQLDGEALQIIQESSYQGHVTKIIDGINFVAFENSLGWITQGFKPQEIEVIK